MLNYTSTRKKTVDHINSTAGNVKSVLYDNGTATIEYEKGAVIKLPIKAGSGIVIDADETGKGIEIHSDGGGGGTVYRHSLTVSGYGQDFYAVFYSSESTKAENLGALKLALGNTFRLPVSGAVNTGALGSGYYIGTYIDETALNVTNITEVKTISYGAITITDTVTAI